MQDQIKTILAELQAALGLRTAYRFLKERGDLRATSDLEITPNRYILMHAADGHVKWDLVEQDLISVVESQPVDRVQAMATLVHRIHETLYSVPDVGVSYLVDTRLELCTCPERNCEHIKAVRLHLAGEERNALIDNWTECESDRLD